MKEFLELVLAILILAIILAIGTPLICAILLWLFKISAFLFSVLIPD